MAPLSQLQESAVYRRKWIDGFRHRLGACRRQRQCCAASVLVAPAQTLDDPYPAANNAHTAQDGSTSVTVTVLANRGDGVLHTGWSTWGALADICWTVAPEICVACKLWHTNDGDGLDADGSAKLADVLEARIHDGTVDRLINDRADQASSMPDEICVYCEGSGVRTDAIGIKHGFDKRLIEDADHPRLGQRGWCNGCGGRGSSRPFKSYYPLKENRSVVEEFVAFLRASGGFRIH
jgi:hypothetical protein